LATPTACKPFLFSLIHTAPRRVFARKNMIVVIFWKTSHGGTGETEEDLSLGHGGTGEEDLPRRTWKMPGNG